jgi:ABC-type lipoprotein release transport system permease subunit
MVGRTTLHPLRETQGRIAAPAQRQAIMACLEKDERVLGVSPRWWHRCFFNVGTVDLNGQVNGIDVMQEVRYYMFADYLVQGDPQDLATGNNTIVLGKGLADLMEAASVISCRSPPPPAIAPCCV